MGLVKTRRLTAMWKQQRAEAGGEADGNAQEWHLATTTWFISGGSFEVAEMKGFVVHLYRNEKVFHP